MCNISILKSISSIYEDINASNSSPLHYKYYEDDDQEVEKKASDAVSLDADNRDILGDEEEEEEEMLDLGDDDSIQATTISTTANAGRTTYDEFAAASSAYRVREELPQVDSSTGSPFQGAKVRSFDTSKKKMGLGLDYGQTKGDPLPIVASFAKKCKKWGVITTIFDPTLAVKRVADLPSWCVVVVADTKTPIDYMQKLGDLYLIPTPTSNTTNYTTSTDGVTNGTNAQSVNIDNVYFFSVEKQKGWEKLGGIVGAFASSIPWKHFSRKNLGYLFAILHGADYIFDFDDDNFIKMETSSASPSPMNILPEENGHGGIKLKNVTVIIQGPAIFNHHPMMKPSVNDSWARGFPLEYILDETTRGKEAFQKDIPVKFKTLNDDIGVLQYLADGNPDVDAFHRLSKAMPMTFSSGVDSNPVLVPMHSYAPYNAQATVHMKKALWATLLPATVPGRVSDIWRSYFSECIFMDAGLRLVFAPPKIFQQRNEHNLLGDMIAETDVYRKSGKLVEFLSKWDSDHDSIPERMEQLWIDLYERGYIEIEDVVNVQMWLAVLSQHGYEFPPLKRRFRNVAVMGQFNYADSEHLYDEIVFWAQKHREYFETVMVAGPFSMDQIQVLGRYSIEAIASTPPRGRRVDGFYGPVENLMNALLLFKNSSKIEGVLYAHDDTVLNVTELSQGLYPFPTNTIIGNTKKMSVHEMSYTDVRTAKDKKKANELSYRIFPNGTFADFNKTVFGDDINTLWDNVPNFYHRWGLVRQPYCAGSKRTRKGNTALANDTDSAKYQEDDGSMLFPSFTQADFLFVPTKYSEEFAEAARLHLKHQVFLECALPQIVDMVQQQTNAPDVRVVKLCTTFHKIRGLEFMASSKCNNEGIIGVVHPLKLNTVGYNAFEREMDSFQCGLR